MEEMEEVRKINNLGKFFAFQPTSLIGKSLFLRKKSLLSEQANTETIANFCVYAFMPISSGRRAPHDPASNYTFSPIFAISGPLK